MESTIDGLNFLSYQHNTEQASLAVFVPVHLLGLFLNFFFNPEDFLKLGFLLNLGLFFGTYHLAQGHIWL